MKKDHPLKTILSSRRSGIPTGIFSVCSANDLVIEAVMERELKDDEYILIEATANQVNQYGGYTGMKPVDFKNFVYSIAEKIDFPKDKIILGGDHLGPLTWKNEVAEYALEESKELIRQFVLAGFTKIHLDTSMHLGGDDPNTRLDTHEIAQRGAILCKIAEEAFAELKAKDPFTLHPVYVVGSEVPIPGGAQEKDEGLQVTRVFDFEETVEVFKIAFYKYDLGDAWDNVIAVVVQPGVEFGDDIIHEYKRSEAKALCQALKKYPSLVFEGHSTDYQTPIALKEMVEDGIAILKAGPALTFALREGLFALNNIENELFKGRDDVALSNFREVLDEVMVNNPEYWKKHYHGTEAEQEFARKYSLSDRCRYYLPVSEVKESIGRMFCNLRSTDVPLTLLSQYMPIQYSKVRNRLLKNDPESLVKDRVVNCVDDYIFGVKQ